MSESIRHKIYFASDFHLGAPNASVSRAREARIVQWLQTIQHDAAAVYLVGDIFDFWFEYKEAIPKGFTRFLGQLAQMRDAGIPIYFFIGNHDMWMFDYFEAELGIPVYRAPILREYGGKKFLIGHGDGLGPGDYGYKRLKRVFANPFCQWLFGWLHPDIGIKIATYWSRRSRQTTGEEDAHFLGKENEWLYQYCLRKHAQNPCDFYIFGHRHLPLELPIDDTQSRYINLGDWISYNTYAVFDGKELSLHTYT